MEQEWTTDLRKEIVYRKILAIDNSMALPNADWNHWRTFVAVMEHGSLSEAARKLSISQPTAGRHIELLEASVGAALFTRSREGLLPSDLAQNLLVDARSMQSAAHALERRASQKGDAIFGTVRITASEIVGTQILPALLARLQDQEPGLTIELKLSNAQDDLLNRDADIAIRLVRPKQRQLVAQKVGSLDLGLYAHASYLRGQPLPSAAAQLRNHRLLSVDRDVDRLANVMIGDTPASEISPSFRCDSDVGQLMALKAGLGIGICPELVAQRDESLIAILKDQFRIRYEVWLAMHEDLKHDRAVRATQKHLAAGLRALLGSANVEAPET